MYSFKVILPFLAIAIIIAVLLSPLASSLPDGLERVAEKLGFSDQATEKPLVSAPLPDYTIPVLGETRLSTSIAGLIGTLICFFLPFSLYVFRKK
jgi:cobalt/nickel transport protein